MKFGKVQDKDLLARIDWQLPPEDPLSLKFLKGLTSGNKTKLWLGAPAWGLKEWVGKIYPPKTPADQFLYHYSRHFNTIELNTTHYRIPSFEQTAKWVSQVGDGFAFCPKIFQGISHGRNGLGDKGLLHEWIIFLENLGRTCGPSFLQLPPSFSYAYKKDLFHFLQAWPSVFPLAIEFRHPTWFQQNRVLPALVEYLQARQMALVITDVSGRRGVLHSSLSAPYTIIRFVGNNLDPSDFTRAQLWDKKLTHWQDLGLNDTYFFIHEPDDISVPEIAEYLYQLNFFSQAKAHRKQLTFS